MADTDTQFMADTDTQFMADTDTQFMADTDTQFMADTDTDSYSIYGRYRYSIYGRYRYPDTLKRQILADTDTLAHHYCWTMSPHPGAGRRAADGVPKGLCPHGRQAVVRPALPHGVHGHGKLFAGNKEEGKDPRTTNRQVGACYFVVYWLLKWRQLLWGLGFLISCLLVNVSVTSTICNTENIIEKKSNI